MKKSQGPPSFDSFSEDESPGFLNRNTGTQTIDMGGLSDEGLTSSGSFDFRDLDTTGVGKLIQSLPLPTAVINESGEVLFANQVWDNFVGNYNRMPSFSFLSLFPSPSVAEKIELAIRESFLTRKTKTLEAMIKIGKQAKWGRMTFRPLRVRKDRSLLLLVEDLTLQKKQVLISEKHRKELEDYNKRLGQEIEQRKLVEENLRVREHQYRQLVESASDVIYGTDANGFFTIVNPVAERTIGYSPQDLTGTHYLEIVHPEFRDQTAQFYGRQFVKRIPDTDYECPVLARDGRMVWLGQHTQLLMDGETVVGFQSVARDITDQKNEEDALKQSEERYRSLFEQSRDGITIVREGGEFLDVNESFARLLGYTKEETLRMNARQTWADPADRVRWQEEMARAGFVVDYERKVRKKDGTVIDCVLSSSQQRSKDGILLYQCFWRDISNLKKAHDLALEASRFKAVADLAAGVGHNFNNLLQVVIGNANLAIKNLQAGEFSDVKENLERILDSSQFGAETVRRLNRFARTHVDEDATLATEVFDLSGLVRQAVEMTRPWWTPHPEKKGIAIDLKTTLANGCLIEGRKNEIFEVVVNLIKNATEALPTGGDIRVETHVESRKVILGVRDTGVGIPETDVDRLFTPFFTTDVEVGRGLGLATTRKIVDDHGGRISVKSLEGQGALFAVSFPLAQVISEMTAPAPISIKDKPLTILAIDDMEAMVDMLGDGLEAFGHTVFTASSGEEGVAILRENPVDLVICDLGMHGMNGWEVGKAIKDFCLERQIPKPPFVILTG